MEVISSRGNILVKNCRSLAADAAERREQGLVFLEGQRLCCEAVSANVVIEQLFITVEALERLGDKLTTVLAAARRCFTVTEGVAQFISQTKGSQGVYCVCRMPEPQERSAASGGCLLLLDRLQDPGNLGTIIRCAEAFGISRVFLSRDCADLWSPKVLRSSMGSCFRQPVEQTDSLTGVIAELRQNGISTYAAALDSTAAKPQSLAAASGGIALVVGNEGNGVSAEVLSACDGCVYIPMTAQIESLNAATAAAVLMWELCGRHEGRAGV